VGIKLQFCRKERGGRPETLAGAENEWSAGSETSRRVDKKNRGEVRKRNESKLKKRGRPRAKWELLTDENGELKQNASNTQLGKRQEKLAMAV